ncbi:MAG: SDR family NAD(P)-dependent oxidoreductase [Chloroflexota bacterium]
MTILITGSTSGIGYALAQQLAQDGADLILLGRRNPSELESSFFTDDRYIQVDLAHPRASETVVTELDKRGVQQINILIHNAGTGYFGDIATQSPQSIATVIDVNLTAPVLLTHALLSKLTVAKGKIVLISSVVANLPAPDYAVYAASKAALDEFCDNLRIELKAQGITVQVIHPGATQTDMHSKLGIPAERMDTSKFPSAETVAGQIIATINSKQSQATIGIPNKLMRFAGKHAAGLIDFAMKRSKA